MTAKDRKLLKVFVVLVVILGVSAYLSLWMNLSSSDGSTSLVTTPQDTQKNLAKDSGGDTRIRLNDLNRSGEGEEVGRVSLFSYRLGQPGRSGAGPGATSPQSSASQPSGVFPEPVTPTPIVPQQPVGPPPPPPPPPMPQFKYDGFVRTPKGLAVSLSDQINHYYNLREDDVVLGRYRIARVTDTVVEVEDLEIPRRQAFSRAQ
jgi:hypothetical protein